MAGKQSSLLQFFKKSDTYNLPEKWLSESCPPKAKKQKVRHPAKVREGQITGTASHVIEEIKQLTDGEKDEMVSVNDINATTDETKHEKPTVL